MVGEKGDEAQIPQFYAGRDVLITGATGFLGKVLVERLLATCPHVGKVFLLTRSKKDASPQTRIERLKKVQIFDELRKTSPSQLDKLIAVPGNLEQPGLGISSEDLSTLKSVSLVFHVAATVKMHEELRVAARQNVVPVISLLQICDQLPLMTAFVHVSTGYCNAERSKIEERVYPIPRPLEDMLQEALHHDGTNTDRLISPKPNTYTYTKTLAEAAVGQHGNRGYPIAIVRPTIVSGSHRHPFPGWVEGTQGVVGVAAALLSGVTSVMRCDGRLRIDLIPVDIAADTLLAAAWEVAVDNPSSARVYNCTAEDPTDFDSLRRTLVSTAREVPPIGVLGVPSLEFTKSRLLCDLLHFGLKTVPFFFIEGVLRLFSTKKNRPDLTLAASRVGAMGSALDYFMNRQFSFDTARQRSLRARLSPADGELFHVDTTAIDWTQTHQDLVKGCRRYIFREDDSSIPAARRRLTRIHLITRTVWAGVIAAMLRHFINQYGGSAATFVWYLFSVMRKLLNGVI